MNQLPRALIGLALAVLAALPARAAELQYRAENKNLEEARSLVGKARYEQALEELQLAETLPGNTNRHIADIGALKATALLGLGVNPERRQQAIEALVSMFHVDPEGTALSNASEDAKALAAQLKAERALLLHDRLVTVRTGRPLRLKARLVGAKAGDVQVFAHYLTEPEGGAQDAKAIAALTDPEQFVKVQLEASGANAYEVYLRPGVGGVPADGEHVIRYYLEAVGAGGVVLDANGSATQPIRVQLSATRAEGAGVGGADNVVVALDEGGHVAHPPPPPPPPPPWYQNWKIVGPIGVVVVAVAVGTIIAVQPKPQPASGTLGTVTLP
ncbi:MAG: hypothetical protein JST92_04485 [Deltaproteobacteria bacterium]|nr:hypothetical protein [Deltaproteobacteria bacterium]